MLNDRMISASLWILKNNNDAINTEVKAFNVFFITKLVINLTAIYVFLFSMDLHYLFRFTRQSDLKRILFIW